MSKQTKQNKELCRNLRKEKHLSYNEIHKVTGIPFSTIQGYVHDIPLPKKVLKEKLVTGQKNSTPKRKTPDKSKLYKLSNNAVFTNNEKGKIAEAAVLLRLCIQKLVVFGSVFDGDKADWIIDSPKQNKRYRIQVRWASIPKQNGKYIGRPKIKLVCMGPRTNGDYIETRFKEGDFDFIIGYHFETDMACIYSWDEIKNHCSMVSFKEDAIEAWHKITG